jgi:hypothetical protein
MSKTGESGDEFLNQDDFERPPFDEVIGAAVESLQPNYNCWFFSKRFVEAIEDLRDAANDAEFRAKYSASSDDEALARLDDLLETETNYRLPEDIQGFRMKDLIEIARRERADNESKWNVRGHEDSRTFAEIARDTIWITLAELRARHWLQKVPVDATLEIVTGRASDSRGGLTWKGEELKPMSIGLQVRVVARQSNGRVIFDHVHDVPSHGKLFSLSFHDLEDCLMDGIPPEKQPNCDHERVFPLIRRGSIEDGCIIVTEQAIGKMLNNSIEELLHGRSYAPQLRKADGAPDWDAIESALLRPGSGTISEKNGEHRHLSNYFDGLPKETRSAMVQGTLNVLRNPSMPTIAESTDVAS